MCYANLSEFQNHGWSWVQTMTKEKETINLASWKSSFRLSDYAGENALFTCCHRTYEEKRRRVSLG